MSRSKQICHFHHISAQSHVHACRRGLSRPPCPYCAWTCSQKPHPMRLFHSSSSSSRSRDLSSICPSCPTALGPLQMLPSPKLHNLAVNAQQLLPQLQLLFSGQHQPQQLGRQPAGHRTATRSSTTPTHPLVLPPQRRPQQRGEPQVARQTGSPEGADLSCRSGVRWMRHLGRRQLLQEDRTQHGCSQGPRETWTLALCRAA